MKPGEIQEADIVDLAHDGRGVARVDGKTVFIDGALPGERVRFRVIKRRRQLDEAGLVEVLKPSPDRVVPACAHFGVCGGCSLQHLSAAAQIAAKERQLLDNLQRCFCIENGEVESLYIGKKCSFQRNFLCFGDLFANLLIPDCNDLSP